MIMVAQMPHDGETEKALLATICAAGADQAASECCAVLREDDFLVPSHRAIFKAIVTIQDEGGEINPLTIHAALEQAKAGARLGGYPALVEILSGDEVGRPMVLVEILQRLRKRRELLRLASQLAIAARDGGETPEEIIEKVGSELSRMAMLRNRVGIRHLSEFSEKAWLAIEDEMAGNHGNATWCKGWPRLNGLLGGFKPGQLVVLAARPGIGKTALALNWILALTEYGKTAGIFSLEMPGERLWRRLVSAHAGADLRAIASRKDRAALERVRESMTALDRRGIWVEDRSSITPREITGEVDGLISRQPTLGLLVVDHLGLVSSSETAKAARQTESTRIGDITRSLKNLAQDRGIPVLLLCQLNREIEKRQGGKPQLSDLRDSGCVEQDSDVVMFIHRKSQDEDQGASLIVAKHREGPTGEIFMNWDAGLVRFSEGERLTDAPVARTLQEVV